MNVQIYDTTLRDGSQGEGIAFSVDAKLEVAMLLDGLGVHVIEGGWPSSNPRDAEFFRRVPALRLRTSEIVAFSYAGRVGIPPTEDPNLHALLDAATPTVTIVGKSWDLHVEKVLRTTLDVNLDLIRGAIAFLVAEGRRVIYDAEQFFDGYKANPVYAVSTLRAAEEGGASTIVLCDTNGGTMPWDVAGLGFTRTTIATWG